MSLLREPHAHHRDLLAGATAQAPPHLGPVKDQDRHLMTPSLPIHDRTGTTYSCWLATGSREARIGLLNSQPIARSTRSRTIQLTLAPPRAYPRSAASQPWQPSKSP